MNGSTLSISWHCSDPSTISHHTSITEGEEDYEDLTESVRLVKEVIAVVDSKVNEHEQRRRLKEFHARMDSKSIMMMKSGQIFAKEDLLRRRLIHDGVLHLKSNQARLKGKEVSTAGPPVLRCVCSFKHKCLISWSSTEVHALLLSDVFVFLQEKDQKYIFAMLVGPFLCLSLVHAMFVSPPLLLLAYAILLIFSSI